MWSSGRPPIYGRANNFTLRFKEIFLTQGDWESAINTTDLPYTQEMTDFYFKMLQANGNLFTKFKLRSRAIIIIAMTFSECWKNYEKYKVIYDKKLEDFLLNEQKMYATNQESEDTAVDILLQKQTSSPSIAQSLNESLIQANLEEPYKKLFNEFAGKIANWIQPNTTSFLYDEQNDYQGGN